MEAHESGPQGWGTVAQSQVREVVKCPICLELPLGKVIICPQGHSTCEQCINRQMSRTCPHCRTAIAKGRNYVSEQILDLLAFDCPYREKGCNVTGLKRSAVLSHLDICQHSTEILLCQRLGFTDCDQLLSFRDPNAYLQHVANGTHCSNKTVTTNQGFHSLFIYNFRKMYDPGFQFLPTLFKVERNVKILIALIKRGGLISFIPILMEDNRTGCQNPPYVVHFFIGQVKMMNSDEIPWRQPVLKLEESKEAWKRYPLGSTFPVFNRSAQKCMRLKNTDLEVKVMIRRDEAESVRLDRPSPRGNVRPSNSVNEPAHREIERPPARSQENVSAAAGAEGRGGGAVESAQRYAPGTPTGIRSRPPDEIIVVVGPKLYLQTLTRIRPRSSAATDPGAASTTNLRGTPPSTSTNPSLALLPLPGAKRAASVRAAPINATTASIAASTSTPSPPMPSLSPQPTAPPTSAQSAGRSRSPTGSRIASSAAASRSSCSGLRQSHSKMNPPPHSSSSNEDDVPRRSVKKRKPNS